MCLFEALAAGVPVVSTRVGWAPQLIKNGENGYLADSVDEIAGALRDIRQNRHAWFERARSIRESGGRYTLEGWVTDCLAAAQRLL